MRSAFFNRSLYAAGLSVMALAGSVQAASFDLTGAAPSVTLNGAIYAFGNTGAAGTGNIDSFVRVQKNGSEQGYNTSANSFPFDEKAGNFTHNIQAGQIPVVKLLNVPYFQFILDINETQGQKNSFLSLDKVQIFTSAVGSKNTTVLSNLGTLRYELGAGNEVLLDSARAGSGSGKIDMTLLVPLSNFAPDLKPSDFVYLYSQFGLKTSDAQHKWSTSGGFEEWAVATGKDTEFFTGFGPVPTVPSPATAPMAALLLAGLSAFRRGRSAR
jgi:hypothetical protein